MFTLPAFSSADKPALYRDLTDVALALTEGESDSIANMANLAALLWQALPDINWAGFYRLVEDELVLGPFQGKPACIRIKLGKGVCGTAAASRTVQRVEDVHAFPGHIACDPASASEIVLPIMVGERVIGVLDIDSPVTARFDAEDEVGLRLLIDRIAGRIAEQTA